MRAWNVTVNFQLLSKDQETEHYCMRQEDSGYKKKKKLF
jgi:hypothetical protein